MKPLYRKNSPVDSAYIVHQGPIYAGVGNWKPAKIECVSIVVGTLAHFAKDQSLKRRGRLFDVFVEDLEQVQKVSFERVDQLVREYDFGFYTNKFLAQLVNLTNQFFFEMTKEIPGDLRRYEAHAQLFARLVDDVKQVGDSTRNANLIKLAEDFAKQQIYKDGFVLNKADLMHAISVPPKHMSEFVKRFKKNTLICKERSLANSMYVLLRGRVGVTVKGKYVASIEGAGESFGELGMFTGGRRTASLVAEEDTDVYEIKQDELAKFHQGHRNVFGNMAAITAKRIAANIEKIEYHVKLVKSFRSSVGSDKKQDSLLEQSQQAIQKLFSALIKAEKELNDPVLRKLLKRHSIV